MHDMPVWSVIVNQSACSDHEWGKWEKMLKTHQVTYAAFKTNSKAELTGVLANLVKEGKLYFLFAGGDGTLHHGGNLLIELAGEKSNLITIGVLPCGTGNDWVRTFGIKKNKLMASLISPKTEPLHLIRLLWPDGKVCYAFNMVGGALDAAVVQVLSKSKINSLGAIKYPIALIKTLMRPHRWLALIVVDGISYHGDWLTLQAGFGQYCGGGMFVLPHAEINEAALLMMRPKTLWRLLTSLPALYNGRIIDQAEAIALHFSIIEIEHQGKPIPIEADGEWLGASPLKLNVEYGKLNRLIAE